MAFDPNKHITKIQGRDYIEVKWRIVWFRDENPQGRIATEIVIAGDTPIAVRASVIDGDGNHLADGMATIRQAEGRETRSWGGREIEKAETAAIGRALAHAGYGTQFTGEVEGDYLADSPVDNGNSALNLDVWNKSTMTAFWKRWTSAGIDGDDILKALEIKALSEWKHSASSANERMELTFNKKGA